MKRLIPSIIILLSFGFAKAQLPEIPNGGFENWENRFLYSKPAVWQTNDNPDFAPLTTIRSEDRIEGDYALRLESILEEREGRDDRVHFGFAVIGQVDDAGPEPIHWENTADMVHLSLKYSIQPGDGGLMWILLDYDGENVFQYMEFLEGEQPDWTQVSFPLDDGGGSVDIDGLLIGFTSSAPEGFPGAEGYEPADGSWLMVDNIFFSLNDTPVENNVPNGGFEDWQDISPFEPVGWTSTNIYAAAYDTANVIRSTDSYSGSYAAKLETVFFDGDDEWGVLSLGDGLWWDGGTGISGNRPYFIGGAYKYQPANPISDDPAFLSLDLRFEGAQISGAYLKFPAAGEYTRFTSSMLGYHTEDDPDFMYLTISSANEAGSVLYIDELEFLHGRQVTFELEGPGEEPVCCAEIVITGVQPVILGDMFYTETDSEGRLTVYLPDGEYTYSIFASGYEYIIDEPLEINDDMLISETLTTLGFESGEGSEQDPWIIVTPAQLDLVRNYIGWDHCEKYFMLGADIDLGTAPWNSGEGWKPVGDHADHFCGSFDGAGFVIYNLTVNRPEAEFTGLFGQTDGAVIANLNISDANISAGNNTGILAGELNRSTVENVHVAGDIIATWSVGGLAAMLSDESSVTNSSFTGSIQAGGNVGGLLGNTWGSTIEHCHSFADITPTWHQVDNVGALIGFNNSTIRFSSSEGSVSGNSWVGGLAGYNVGQIEQSYSTAEVTSTGEGAGGLVGWNDGEGSVSNSYSTGSVNGNESAGGFAGKHTSSQGIDRSYSTGHVSGNDKIGGFAGEADGMVTNSYWNTETSGQTESAGGAGYDIEGMTTGSTFDGWNFESPGIWSIVEGETFPWLQWEDGPSPHNYPPVLETMYTVSFTVVKEDDTPVEGAIITITQNASEVEALTTGSDGKAETSLPAGDYGYTVTLVEYEDDSGTFTVTDQDVEIAVTLIHTAAFGPAPSGKRILVYPNPGDGLFTVEYAGTAASTVTLEVMSVAGNLLYVREFYGADNLKETIDLRHVSRGIYFLRARENGKVKTIKLLFR